LPMPFSPPHWLTILMINSSGYTFADHNLAAD